MSETLIPAQGPVDVLVGRLRTHAEAHEYIANADPEQKQWMNDLYDAADAIERAPRWRDVADEPPPFDMKLLLMVAGSRSEDCGRTFEPYTVVMTAYVQQQGPGDEYDEVPAFDEYMSGDQPDFLDFQFNLKDEDGEVLDWYSDSIVAWAYYPLGIAQTAVNVERERQAALVPNAELTGPQQRKENYDT